MRKARVHPEDSAIFHEGDIAQGVLIVCEGKVKIFKTTRMGKTLTTKVLPPGSLFGYRSLFAQEPYSASAAAFTDAVVSRIEARNFVPFLKRHWPATLKLLEVLCQSVRQSEDKARDIAFSSAKSRLAQALLTFVKKDDKNLIVTTERKELAQIAGIVPETCVRLLDKFEIKKLLKRPDRKSIEILDYSGLQKIAGGALSASQ